MQKPADMLHLDGTVEYVSYRNEDTGFVVLELDSGGERITVVGELGAIEVGEDLHLTGSYTTHPTYGTQFKAYLCERSLPATAAAIKKYLCSGAMKGIGPIMAARLVDAFGDETLNVMEKTPLRLSEVKGVSVHKAEEIGREYQRLFGVRTAMLFLSKYGVTPGKCVRIWKKWGNITVDVVTQNPYVLCGEGIDMSFEEVDAIAQEFEVEPDDPHRLLAGICYVLKQNSYNGHTCLPRKILIKLSVQLLGAQPQVLEAAVDQETGEENGELCLWKKGAEDFVCLRKYYTAEMYIASRLSLLRQSYPDSGEDYSGLIRSIEKENGIEYAQLQREAIARTLSGGVMVLTGGPGTGKTTTLNGIIAALEHKGLKVAVCAPTGRAAKRASELTGKEAKTIHRLLEMQFAENDIPKFQRNEGNPLPCDAVVVDEMSMVDVLLLESLLRGMKLSARLIMVGDSDQLPSVGAGNVLKDITDSGCVQVVRLNEVFRQASQSLIVTNAHAIVKGELPEITRKDGDFFMLQRGDYQSAQDTIVELYEKRLPASYGFSCIDDIQVLCPGKKSPVGVYELNFRLQQAVNPPTFGKAEVRSGQYLFREGDKVMQVRNNYDVEWTKGDEKGTGVFNGDMGVIRLIDKPSGKMLVEFDERVAEYDFENLSQLELAYAATVHKSQGSEFNAVILAVYGGYDLLYFRNLLYTAVTRAKKILIIVGSKSRLWYMVHNDRKTLRYTCLRSMLRNADA